MMVTVGGQTVMYCIRASAHMCSSPTRTHKVMVLSESPHETCLTLREVCGCHFVCDLLVLLHITGQPRVMALCYTRQNSVVSPAAAVVCSVGEVHKTRQTINSHSNDPWFLWKLHGKAKERAP